jgi:hypothetical protein
MCRSPASPGVPRSSGPGAVPRRLPLPLLVGGVPMERTAASLGSDYNPFSGRPRPTRLATQPAVPAQAPALVPLQPAPAPARSSSPSPTRTPLAPARTYLLATPPVSPLCGCDGTGDENMFAKAPSLRCSPEPCPHLHLHLQMHTEPTPSPASVSAAASASGSPSPTPRSRRRRGRSAPPTHLRASSDATRSPRARNSKSQYIRAVPFKVW